ncbi:hypothetical protein [Chitinophaga filiformis]|uniref:Uncharacterized protein n=1 Tax=Chitinophaga filiformis TaxID=104663 RepID=A0ABY4HVJ9_CHIFI|nr:hypothetical protein [Chitinophaga filiformis]UPK67194.1 hypothetical protein MYF79_19835 [Chitinophaga filiformis]
MEKKFCCEKFRFRYEGNSEMGLNFRIIKLSQNFLDRGYWGDNVYRYYITEGYHVFDDKIKAIVMEFCPFCGKKLKSIYKSDEYINESNHPY